MHAARALLAKKEDKKEWGFLLVDAANAFNDSSHITYLWTVRYR